MLTKEDVQSLLHDGICEITFTKVNGEERVMKCTLNEKLLPKQIDLEEAIQKKKPNPDVLAVWDITAEGWRSFRWDSLISCKAG
jgi:esterase/lipase superfamily enzyme